MIPQKDLSVLQFLNFVGQMTRDNGLPGAWYHCTTTCSPHLRQAKLKLLAVVRQGLELRLRPAPVVGDLGTLHSLVQQLPGAGTSSTVQYSTVQHSTAQYSTVQYSTVEFSTVE